MKNILNEELNRMKYLFGHQRGVVISEQAAPGGLTGAYDESKKEYTIAKGDTLSKIGKAFGVAWKDIYEKNKANLKSGNPNMIYAGEKLIIPGEDAGTTTTTTTTTVPEKATATGINVTTTFEQLATGAEKMNNQPFNTFAYFVKVAPGADPNLPNTGQVDGVASPLKTEDFKAKYKDYDTYRFVATPDGGFKPGMGEELEKSAVYGKETVNKDKEVEVENKPEKTIQQIEYDSQSQWCKDNTITTDPYLEKCFSGTVKPGQPLRNAEDEMARIGRQQGFQYKRDQNFDQATGVIEQVRGPKALSADDRKVRENKKPKNMVGGMTRDEFDKDTTNMIATDQKLEGADSTTRDRLKELLKSNKGSVLGLGEAGDLNRAQRRSLRDAKRQLNSEPKSVGKFENNAPGLYVYNPDERKYKYWVVATA